MTWLEKIVCTNDEKQELKEWCEYIGYSSYEKLYYLISKYTKNKQIEFSCLKSVAKYDFHLSEVYYSMIKLIELRFRSFLINNYGKTNISKSEYLYQISESLNGGHKRLDCSTYYDKKLGDNTTLANFLEEAGMETLWRVFQILPDEQLKVFNSDIKSLKKDLERIRELRNHVYHGQVLLGNDKFSTKETFIVLLRYMPNQETRNKRINALKELNEQLFGAENIAVKDIKKHVIIELNESDYNAI